MKPNPLFYRMIQDPSCEVYPTHLRLFFYDLGRHIGLRDDLISLSQLEIALDCPVREKELSPGMLCQPDDA